MISEAHLGFGGKSKAKLAGSKSRPRVQASLRSPSEALGSGLGQERPRSRRFYLIDPSQTHQTEEHGDWASTDIDLTPKKRT